MLIKTRPFSLILLILSLFFFACEKKMASIPENQPVPGPLVIIAEVLEIPGSFPANELYSYVYVMKYKVIKVIRGNYADTEILIGHYNPRLARTEIKDGQDSLVGGNVKSFQTGDSHYLVLEPMESIWNGATEDNFFKEKQTRYWAHWADKLN